MESSTEPNGRDTHMRTVSADDPMVQWSALLASLAPYPAAEMQNPCASMAWLYPSGPACQVLRPPTRWQPSCCSCINFRGVQRQFVYSMLLGAGCPGWHGIRLLPSLWHFFFGFNLSCRKERDVNCVRMAIVVYCLVFFLHGGCLMPTRSSFGAYLAIDSHEDFQFSC